MLIAAEIARPASVGWYVHPSVFWIPSVLVSQLLNNKSYSAIVIICFDCSLWPLSLFHVSCGTIKCTMIVKRNFFLVRYFFFFVKEEDKNVSVIKSLFFPFFLIRGSALLIISLFRLDTSRQCGQYYWVCDWRHCEEEIFWKTVNLIVPTKQVRGKRKRNKCHF